MRKKVSYILFICCILIIVVGCKKDNNLFVNLEKDNVLVDKAMSYLKYSVSDKKLLMIKLFDNNNNLIIEDDLTNEEKMFLVLDEYDRLNDSCIYGQIGRLCSFKINDIKNLVFDNTEFIKEYMDERQYYSVAGIDLMYNKKVFQAQGHVRIKDEKIAYFDIKEAKKNDDELVIEFVLSYLDFYYINDFLDKEIVHYYKNINDNDFVLEKENDITENNALGLLDETLFNKFRYTLKIKDGNVYFKSIEKI